MPFSSLCNFNSLLPIRFTPSPLPLPPCVTGELWDGGKAACRKFFPPSALTCSPAGQHILSTSVGLAGQTQPYLLFSLSLSVFLSPVNTLICSSGSLRCGGGGGRRQAGRHFQLNHTFQRFPPPVFFRCSYCKRVWKKRGKGIKYKHMWHTSNVTVSIPDTWLVCQLKHKTRDKEGGWEREMWSEWKCWGWRRISR